MSTLNLEIDSLRSLSKIFTTSNFKEVIFNDNTSKIDYGIKQHLDKGKFTFYHDVIEYLYKKLSSNYCNEYIYKNKLFHNELLKKYQSTSNAIMLDEFQVGKSKADFVILNGEIKIFEIKTELDSFCKLEKQISDYNKIADKVYIVVSYKDKDKILSLYSNTNLGIVILTKRGALKEEKKALNNKKFNHEVIFKSLRKKEYLNIINNYFGIKVLENLIISPNTLIFNNTLKLIKQIDIFAFQKLALTELKNRKIKNKDILYSNDVPKELKHICYNLDLSLNEYSKLDKFLTQKI
ncbi:MAG: sce7726 family protein [Candidatus Gracilibacteria bacterium]